jgi:glycosyltransferase involved in cell wall biosynthesis
MFSVIIPLYNKALYIEKAIQSVLAQTFHEFELIVIDDGSTDESFAQLSVISQQLSVEEPNLFRKIKIVQQENRGVSTTRNNGVKLAQYEYIAFLDADDWWEPTYLEEMKGLIEEYPEAEIYGCNYYKVQNGRNIPAQIGVEPDFERGLINYCRVYFKTMYMPLWTGATILKKIVFESENGFKPTLTLGEDFDLWIRVALKYPVAFLNRYLAFYNQDVEVANRGVIFDKLYKPETHFIFNLDYLSEEEKQNRDLKNLLDLLRVYTLERYRLQGQYKVEYMREIQKVDFGRQPMKIKLFYYSPLPILKMWHSLLRYAGDLKRRLVR